MKEVCFVNAGENLEKIAFSLNIDTRGKTISRDQLMGFRYFVMNGGDDDIIIVRNYKPYYIVENSTKSNIIDLYSECYDIFGDSSGELLVISQPVGLRYSVKPLETLDEISNRFGVEKAKIVDGNALRTEKLFVGQVLII